LVWQVSTPGEYLETRGPLGRADLPTASYTEMMEWALPTRVRQRYHEVFKGVQRRDRKSCLSFVAVPGAAFFANTRNPICCTRKCCAFPPAIAAAPARHDDRKAADELLQARRSAHARPVQ